MSGSVEEVSASLVREYLSRKGLKRTIACMDEEHPRTESSINNRSQLRLILHMEALYRDNKVQSSPLKTLLEILVKHYIEEGSRGDRDRLQSASSLRPNTPSQINDTAAEQKTGTLAASNHVRLRSHVQEVCHSQPSVPAISPPGFWNDDPLDQKVLLRTETEKKPPENIQRSRPSRVRRAMIAGPIASTLQESNKIRGSRRVEVRRPALRNEEENTPTGNGLSLTGSHPKRLTEVRSADLTGGRLAEQTDGRFEKVEQSPPKTRTVGRSWSDLKTSELVLDDVDDDDDEPPLDVSLRKTIAVTTPGRPMDQRTASELKGLFLGSCLSCFGLEWRRQGFTFSETHDLRYGLVQRKGGPCGVLASVQAFFLKILLFGNTESANTGLRSLRPSNVTRRKCLVLAAAEILWRAGEEKRATVAISTDRNHFTPAGSYKSEGVLEKLTCFTVDNVKDLQLLLEQHIDQFETDALGCLLLTISAVLSRSVEKVREDMDVSTATLIGAHGYCTQELVNLLLCGRAVSNVFDDDVELDTGDGNTTLLKGIKGRCDIGLLSLFEHYNICKVGTHLKTPLYPIWVVCSESHFSVLFGLQRELLTNQDKDFDLYYYDGLANQQEEIRLTVSAGRWTRPDVSTDLVPPLDHCIRTRWSDALVSWNDTEPIL